MPAAAQSPRIEVLGVYSLIASREQYERCVAEHVASCDPANLSPRMREFFIQHGRDVEPLTEEEKKEAEVPIRLALCDTVYFEALVHEVDVRFSAADFVQPDLDVPEGQWQVAWNLTYLSIDGETVLSGYPDGVAPSDSTLRVAFTIHCRKQTLPLLSSYGPLACPPTQPMPDRLWRLVPYEMVD